MATAPADLLAARIARLRGHLRDAGLDTLLVTHLPNVFYLTGFRGTAGALVLTGDQVRLVVDPRYLLSAREVVRTLSPAVDAAVQPAGRALDEAIVDALRAIGASRVGVEGAHLSVKRWEWLKASLDSSPDAPGVRSLVTTDRLVEQGRLVKDSFEIETLRTAGRLLSAVAEGLADLVRAGRTERDVAADLDAAIGRAGFERPAFDTIVASGPNSALPHARPGQRALGPGDPVVLDFGGVYDGYCVDLTRTLSVGPPTDELARLHAAVAAAQAAAMALVRPGVLGSAIDGAAREVLAGCGLAEAFGHGTGHGLGVEVHEEPRLGRPVPGLADIVIEPGMVFTLEPGVYLPDVGGVRIEDDVLVTAQGCEPLTNASRALTGR